MRNYSLAIINNLKGGIKIRLNEEDLKKLFSRVAGESSEDKELDKGKDSTVDETHKKSLDTDESGPKRDEIIDFFEEDKEILYYETPQDILRIIKSYSDNTFHHVGLNAYKRCQKEHNISHRIDALFKNLNNIFGERLF